MPVKPQPTHTSSLLIILLLSGLLSLFGLRVLGQFLVFLGIAPLLPPMEAWYSGLLPYGPLLVSQLLILAFGIKIIRDIASGSGYFSAPHSSLGKILGIFGWLYAGGMGMRYALTMLFRPEMRWTGGTIPITFHIVLASYILILARHLDRKPH